VSRAALPRGVRRGPLAAAALGAAALLAACGGNGPAQAVPAPPVMVALVEGHDVTDRIEATGELKAKAEATVAAQVDGQVTRIVKDEGASVAAGDVVVEIDPERRELERRAGEAGVTDARSQLSELDRDAARLEHLHGEGVASQARVDQARTDLSRARARVSAAEAQLGLAERALRDSNVEAPFAGFVAHRWVPEGEFVARGSRLFGLVALDPVEVEFNLPERHSERAALGASVDVRVEPFPAETFRGVVTLVSPIIDPATRTLRVKAEVRNEDGRLRPGLFARADLGVAERRGVPMIPEEAVLERSDGSVAFRMKDADHVERRNLRLGLHRDGMVEVLSGIQVGDRVVVRGQTALLDGALVSLRDAEGRPLTPGAAAAPVAAAGGGTAAQ